MAYSDVQKKKKKNVQNSWAEKSIYRQPFSIL